MRVRLYESLRALFYTPYYLALELGCNAAEGLEIELARPATSDRAALDLFEGKADVTWGGPMRMLQTMDRDPDPDRRLIAFGEAVTRDPFFLVGREPNPEFRLDNLIGRKVATVAEVPTPWLCLQEDLKRAGLDPAAFERVDGATMAENAAALRAGDVDVIQVFEPFVETLVREGAGHVLRAAAARGATSYTTYYAPIDYLRRERAACVALARALAKAQRWLHASRPEAIAERVQPYFPDVPDAVLAGAIRRYFALGVWGSDPRLPLTGFLRLKMALVSGGFIARDIAYEDCVDRDVIRDAMSG